MFSVSIHFSLNSYYFHILEVIISPTTMNMGVQISLHCDLFFSLNKYTEWEFLDNIVVLFLIFWGDCCPQWLYQFTFPPTMYEVSFFSTSQRTLVTFWFFSINYFLYCMVYFHTKRNFSNFHKASTGENKENKSHCEYTW